MACCFSDRLHRSDHSVCKVLSVEGAHIKAKTIAIVAGLIVSGFVTWVSAAWPERPITFIVPYAAGGANDNSARTTAQ